MSKHTVKVEDLKDYEFSHQIAGSFGENSHKSITIVGSTATGKIQYAVKDHGILIEKTASLEKAVETYNFLN